MFLAFGQLAQPIHSPSELTFVMALETERTERADRSTDQQIADLEAQIARLRERKRTEENGQKIILGSLLLTSARHDPKMAAWVCDEAEKFLVRDVDKKRMAPLLRELAIRSGHSKG